MGTFKKYLKIILGVALFLHVVNSLTQYSFSFWGYFLSPRAAFINLVYNTVILLVLLPFFDFIEKKLSWDKQGVQKFFSGLLGSIVLLLITIILLKYSHYVIISKELTHQEFIADLPNQKNSYVFSALIGAGITLFFMAWGFIKAIQEKKVKEQKIIANTATAKFDALRNQLDPHFLFNSLNVLTALIDEDAKAARRFTTDLAKVYRYILEQKTKDVVPLKDEIKFGKTYISLLQKRFEDCLIVHFPNKLENPEGKIIPLSLQLLLENAVKHNVVTTDKPLTITIFEKDGFLHIENNLQPKTVMQFSTGVGLTNIKTRYEMLRTKTFEVQKTNNAFIAKLPILNKDTTVINTEIMDSNYIVEYDKAQSRVKKRKEFYFNLAAYAIGMIVLLFFNLKYSPDYLWIIYPAIGWGIGVIAQALIAFKKNPFISSAWEKRKLQQLFDENKIFGLEKDLGKKHQIANQYIIKQKEFYNHLVNYLLVNPGLMLINYIQDGWQTTWFLFPLIGWGLGLLSHAIYTFKNSLVFGADWEAKEIQKILDKQNKHQ